MKIFILIEVPGCRPGKNIDRASILIFYSGFRGINRLSHPVLFCRHKFVPGLFNNPFLLLTLFSLKIACFFNILFADAKCGKKKIVQAAFESFFLHPFRPGSRG